MLGVHNWLILGEAHFCGRCGQLLNWCRDQLGKPVTSSQVLPLEESSVVGSGGEAWL